MATSFKKTYIKTGRVLSEKITPDETYWQNFETPRTVKEFGTITHIEFNPIAPHNFAVTNSMKVGLYETADCSPLPSLGRFKDTTYSGSFRNDGKMMVVGTEDKYIKLFHTKSRSLLRTFLGNKGPVWLTRFLKDGFRLISGSDDKSVRVWDIPTEKNVTRYREHKDYVRTGLASKASNDIFLTGSYDHTVKLWDARSKESALTVNHGFPVESVLMFPNGGVFMSAGGNYVKVWDALSGGKLLATLSNHHKTVTSLCFCSNHERFMSASLDQCVKVYDVGSYQVVSTIKYPGPILTHAVSPDDEVLAVGMADKMLSIKKRKPTEEGEPIRINTKKRDFTKHKLQTSYKPRETDQVTESVKRGILASYDSHLRKFNHSKALDDALKVRIDQPEVTVSVIQELIRRGHIRTALAGRNESGVCVILKFIFKNINNPQFTATLIDLLNLLLDLYAMTELLNSSLVQSNLMKIRMLVDKESDFLTNVNELLGSLSLLFSVSENGLDPPMVGLPATGLGDDSLSLSSGQGHNGTDTPMDTSDIGNGDTKSLLDSIGSLLQSTEA